jgi:hypothetical protein
LERVRLRAAPPARAAPAVAPRQQKQDQPINATELDKPEIPKDFRRQVNLKICSGDHGKRERSLQARTE